MRFWFLSILMMTAALPALAETAAAVEAALPAKESSVPVLKEAEIPLRLETKKEAAAEASPWSRLVLGLLVLAATAGGAFYYLRRYRKPGAGNGNLHIKVLTQHYLGPKRSLAVIRVAGESILIGVTDQNISMIKSLALIDDEIVDEIPQNFSGAMAQADRKTSAAITAAVTAPLQDGEEFQLTGLHQIKDVVHRKLKNMRSLE